MTPGFWPYVDLHAALAHWAAGQQARVRQLEHAIEVCAQGNDYAALRAGYITAPGLRALRAWAEGRYGEAAKLLAALQPLLGYAGGSRVQLDIFTTIERDAVHRQRARHCDLPSVNDSERSLIAAKLVAGVFAEPQNKRNAKALAATS